MTHATPSASNVKRFSLLLKHDKGFTRIDTTASSQEAAIQQVMTMELCPRSAIKQVIDLGNVHATPSAPNQNL